MARSRTIRFEINSGVADLLMVAAAETGLMRMMCEVRGIG
jgi:hypothetical protein